MGENIVMPKYTAEKIRKLRYGADEKKSEDNIFNPAVRKVAALHILTIFLIFCYWAIMIEYELLEWFISPFQHTFEAICNQFLVELILSDSASGRLMAIVITVVYAIEFLIALIVFAFILPYKVFKKIPDMYRRKCIEQGLIHVPDISYSQYSFLAELYNNAEEIKGYLESSSICEVYVENDDVVRLCIHDLMISKEYKFDFKGLANKVFKPDIIDFSVLDKLVDLVIEDHNETADIHRLCEKVI